MPPTLRSPEGRPARRFPATRKPGPRNQRPAVDATLALNGTDVGVTAGQSGRELDIPNTLALVGVQTQSMQDAALKLFI